MNGQIITVALILLGHIFLTPAVQAIGFDYYNDHGVMSYGKGYWGDKKIIAQFPEMSRADLRLVKNISGKTGYIPSDEISIKNERREPLIFELVKKGRCPFLTKEFSLRPARFHA